MRREGILRDRSQPRTWPRKGRFNGCKMKGNLDNIVLIDVDSDSLDNVIIIDVPESLQQELRGSSVLRKGKKIQFSGIINIDDDEGNNMECPEMGGEAGADLDSDTSSSKSSPASDYVHKSVNLGDDDCQVVREKKFAFGLSKCKESYRRENPCRNRYGLSPESESCSSDSDCSLEGSFGKLHKQWEKAFRKRKSNLYKGKSGLEDQASPSCLNNDINIEVEERSEPHLETSFCCNRSNANHSKPSFVPMEDGDLGTASMNPGVRDSFAESDQKVHHESFQWMKPGLVEKVHSTGKKPDFQFRGETFTEDPSSSSSGWKTNKHMNGCGRNSCHEEQNCRCNQEQEDKQYHSTRTFFMDKPKTSVGEQCNPKGFYWFFHHIKTGLEDEEPSTGMQNVCNEKAGQLDTERPDCKRVSMCNSEFGEMQGKVGNPFSAEVKAQDMGSTADGQPSNVMNGFHAESVSVVPAVPNDIINEREKLKETDEYKQAMEEEWASRQRQLQIQAEEAQRLRKKKRAESMRLLDMERRQKQRLEEIRQTQKKDEENMNLKEQLRSEVRNELSKLETTCIDMASLLRALGIHVGSSFHPLSHEVHAAYKRALLRFHPDRASKTDIRQQVEAEEKFKLISRMKEKFLLTSCH